MKSPEAEVFLLYSTKMLTFRGIRFFFSQRYCDSSRMDCALRVSSQENWGPAQELEGLGPLAWV